MLVMLPKAAEPKLPFGCENSGVFIRLNISALKSTSVSPGRLVCLTSAKSMSRYAGPRAGLREAEPIVNCGAVAKAAVLKYCPGVRWSGGRFGFPTRFGRCKAKPAKALLLVAWVMVTGIPDCRDKMPLRAHPPNTELARPEDANR